MTDNPASPSLGTGPETTPEASIAALLSDDLTIGDNDTDETVTTDDDGETPQGVQSAGEESPEAQSEESDDSEEAPETDEDSEDQSDSEEPLYTVKVDGKSIQVPQTELINGYQRQSDYSRKTASLAAERKQFDESRAQHQTETEAVVQERGYYKSVLGQLQQAVDNLTVRAPTQDQWNALREENPTEYLIQKESWNVLQSQRQAAEAELNNLRTKEQQDQNRNWQSHVQKAAQTFKDSIPAWKDEQLGRKELGELVQYAKSVGYTDQEIQGAADPRALKALYDSMKLQALQQGANNLRPTKGKTLAAGSPQRPANQSKRSDAMKRLRSSGSVDDAATILATMLE